jgi:flagellar motor switch/type III secretory pathway protein FliN
VFDDVRAVGGAFDVRWPARLRVLGQVAPVSVDGDDGAQVDGAFSSIVTAPSRVSADADTQVVVAAELATMTLSGRQILTLIPGATLGVGPRSRTVTLRVAGERLAEGELTDVDGELGVRVVAVRRPFMARASAR